jgi:hypothetical protein
VRKREKKGVNKDRQIDALFDELHRRDGNPAFLLPKNLSGPWMSLLVKEATTLEEMGRGEEFELGMLEGCCCLMLEVVTILLVDDQGEEGLVVSVEEMWARVCMYAAAVLSEHADRNGADFEDCAGIIRIFMKAGKRDEADRVRWLPVQSGYMH